MAEIKDEELILRLATEEDLIHFDELAVTVHFDVGLHNWKLYYSVCPEEFRVFTEKKTGKMVGILTGNALNDKFYWVHQVIILPEYRSKNRFQKSLQQILHHPYSGASRNGHSIQALRSFPCHFINKQVGYFGPINHEKRWISNPPNGITVVKLDYNVSTVNQKLLQNLYKYDDLLYNNIPAPKRRAWLEKYLFPEDPKLSSTVVAYNTDDLTVYGFGVGRYQTKNVSAISPMYANSDQIAYSILAVIANHLPVDNVYMEFDATRRICFQFATEANLTQTPYSYMRSYMPYEYKFPIEKLYCVHEFWPM